MARRPLFNRSNTFTVVLPIRLTGNEILEPGTDVSRQDFGLHRLMNWHRRGRIGEKGSDWCKERLASWEQKSQRSKKKKTSKKKAKKSTVASAAKFPWSQNA